MLGGSQLAAQLVASQVVLSSKELVRNTVMKNIREICKYAK
jgi:hypothetical protein